MATLTASGINCSNGTLDGQYTGTAAGNTSYPIGSYAIMYWYCTCVGAQVLNYTMPGVFTNNSSAYFSRFNPGGAGAAAVAGTWRSRGYVSGSYLLQRVA